MLVGTGQRRVAVIDDDAGLRNALRSFLRSTGLDVEEFASAEDFLAREPERVDCMLIDVGMPGRSGPALVRELRASGQPVPVVFISGHERPNGLETGDPFLRKPVGGDDLLDALHEALARRPDRDIKESSMNAIPLHAVERPSDRTLGARGFARIVGVDGDLAEVVQRVRTLARADAPLLLQGETGTGKELFARAVHEELFDVDSSTPFVVMHCAGLPREQLQRELFGYVDGAFEGARAGGLRGRLAEAAGGTLFLDELGDLPLDLQGHLLRVLESGEFYPVGASQPERVSFRLITASSRDLRAEAKADAFRKDLYFRIAANIVELPPLRARRDDLAVLVDHFVAESRLRHHLGERHFSSDAYAALLRYGWPGNVRELRGLVDASCLLAGDGDIEVGALPEELQARNSVVSLIGSDARELPRGLQKIERAAIEDALRAYAGNLTRVAQELQIARSTLYLKLKKYELEHVLGELRSVSER